MEVALPRFVQVVMAGGDRYLAANAAVIRALVAPTAQLDAQNYQVLARVQMDAAWLNPAHGDNYYIATAILPWQGEFDATQYVLERAIKSRAFDPMPAFYYGFNIFYFKKDPLAGAEWLNLAASREINVRNRFAFKNMAALWVEKGSRPAVAIAIVEAMAKTNKDSAFRRYLLQRVERLRGLQQLQAAAAQYEQTSGKRPKSLIDLVSSGYLKSIPIDPFGFGYGLDKNGVPIQLNRPPKKR